MEEVKNKNQPPWFENVYIYSTICPLIYIKHS